MTNITSIEALGDPTRRRLFERLLEGPCSVSELVAEVPVSQPAVSQHLRVLREARLVDVEKRGQQRIYRARPEGLAELRAYVDGLWAQVLGVYEQAAQSFATEEAMVENVRSTPVLAPVVKSVTVGLPVEAAFRLFTVHISRWWPLASHSVGGDDTERCVLEGHVGGRFYEVQKDGTESDWGRVLAWEPPHRVAFTMHPGLPPEVGGEVEVTFESEAGGTRVTLTHGGWERRGEKAEAARQNYDGGWEYVLGHYVSQSRLMTDDKR